MNHEASNLSVEQATPPVAAVITYTACVLALIAAFGLAYIGGRLSIIEMVKVGQQNAAVADRAAAAADRAKAAELLKRIEEFNTPQPRNQSRRDTHAAQVPSV